MSSPPGCRGVHTWKSRLVQSCPTEPPSTKVPPPYPEPLIQKLPDEKSVRAHSARELSKAPEGRLGAGRSVVIHRRPSGLYQLLARNTPSATCRDDPCTAVATLRQPAQSTLVGSVFRCTSSPSFNPSSSVSGLVGSVPVSVADRQLPVLVSTASSRPSASASALAGPGASSTALRTASASWLRPALSRSAASCVREPLRSGWPGPGTRRLAASKSCDHLTASSRRPTPAQTTARFAIARWVSGWSGPRTRRMFSNACCCNPAASSRRAALR